MFRSKVARIAPRTFFVAGNRQDGGTNRKRTGRFRACCPHAAECRKGVLFPTQAKSRQPERCPGRPIPRFLRDKNLSLPLRRFSRAVRSTAQQLQVCLLL